MQTLTPLTALDRAFLFLDRRNQPFHVAYLNLFSPPRSASPEFVSELTARLRADAEALPPFNRKLERRFGGDWWVEAQDFDIDQHLVHLTLPAPGRMQDLMALVSRLHETHLDRSCPLWRMYVIEGLSDGRIATYCKMHHALADGVAGTRLLLRSMSPDPHARLRAPWAIAFRDGTDASPAPRKPPLASRMFAGLTAVPGLIADVREMVRDVKEGFPEVVGGAQAPACILNQGISGSREFAARPYSLTRIKALSQTFGGTTNDIALALCAAALRRFLIERNALPKEPLIAMVPMSTRSDDSTDGNQIVPLLVNLATHMSNPVDRLRLIRRSAEHSKARFRGLTPVEAYAYAIATSGLGLLKLLFKPSAGRLPFNLVISHVSGPSEALYWQGCRLDAMYPMSVLIGGLALNITLASRSEWLDFGLVACRRTLPHTQRLLVYLEDALNELETLAALRASPVGDGAVPVPAWLRAEIKAYKPRKRIVGPQQLPADEDDSAKPLATTSADSSADVAA